MFVCICHAVSDKDIQTAVESGVSSFDELQRALKISTSCGTCTDEASALFDESLTRALSQRSGALATEIVLSAA